MHARLCPHGHGRGLCVPVSVLSGTCVSLYVGGICAYPCESSRVMCVDVWVCGCCRRRFSAFPSVSSGLWDCVSLVEMFVCSICVVDCDRIAVVFKWSSGQKQGFKSTCNLTHTSPKHLFIWCMEVKEDNLYNNMVSEERTDLFMNNSLLNTKQKGALSPPT